MRVSTMVDSEKNCDVCGRRKFTLVCPRPTLSDSICGRLCARRTHTRTRTCCWVDLCPCLCPPCRRRRRRRSSATPRSRTHSRWLASTLLLQDTNNNITMKAWSAITRTYRVACLYERIVGLFTAAAADHNTQRAQTDSCAVVAAAAQR